ncbi:alpha/beta hydrolase [Cronobacter dublinensis]|uniref:alpha/beta fold hydrolase n=1 Tax=Cronobacter dublinensis TaxID=413497 RepID=UPI001375E837|nr:alpha/beta hydrolase [Cronobacter dublinensis]
MDIVFREMLRRALTGLCLFMTLNSSLHAEELKIKNIVLVHGAFADGSSWNDVITRLQKLGYHVTAVQNPLTSLRDDVRATQRILARQQGDVLLVGHSWAGAVITEAGNAANVRGLVYLSALAPDSGESVADALARLKAPMEGMAPDKEGFIWLDNVQAFHAVMANDVPSDKVEILTAVQQPVAAGAFSEKVKRAAWHYKPSWYLLTENDKALKPSVQREFAGQMGATVTTLNSSHMSMVSHPDAVVQMIDKAARDLNKTSR